jgi:hypothetical protein
MGIATIGKTAGLEIENGRDMFEIADFNLNLPGFIGHVSSSL